MKINYRQLRTNLTEQLTPFFPGSALYVIGLIRLFVGGMLIETTKGPLSTGLYFMVD